jgi:hypothetical protein
MPQPQLDILAIVVILPVPLVHKNKIMNGRLTLSIKPDRIFVKVDHNIVWTILCEQAWKPITNI